MRSSLLMCRTLIMGIVLVLVSAAYAENWPQWRGPDGTGAAPSGNPPTTWSETENVRWKTPLPGHGASTPIIWGDKIFIQTAVPEGDAMSVHAFKVLCFDRNTGKQVWEQTPVSAQPHEGHHPTAGFSPYSPVTDGTHLWVSFGTHGLYCYDLDGALQWKASLPRMTIKNNFGEGSSPALAGDAIIVLADHMGQSEIMAFNKNTGKEIWRKDRDEDTTWSSPAVAEVNGELQVIINATNAVRSYDAKTGEVIWTCSGQTPNVIPTPVVGDGEVYCTSGFRASTMHAITLGRTGDLTDSDAIRWQVDSGTPYVPTPLLYQGRLYLNAVNRAVVSCYAVKDGAKLYAAKPIKEIKTVYASAVGAGGRVYIPGREGTVAVIDGGDEFKILAVNQLDDAFDAPPAVVGDALFLRGASNLYCIAK